MEQTLVILKPAAVHRHIMGEGSIHHRNEDDAA